MIAQQIVNGLMLGSVYALAAMGLTLIYAVMKFLNLAHGAMVVVTVYAGYLVAITTGVIWLTILAAVVSGALLALLMEKLAFSKVRQEIPLISAVLAIGLTMLFEESLRMGFYSGRPVSYPNSVQLNQYIDFSIMRLSLGHILLLSITIVIMIALYIFMDHTQKGRALQAVAENRNVAQLLGVNQKGMYTITFIIAGILAGFSGSLYGIVYAGISPYVAMTFTFKALAVTLFAGAGNIWGAVICGILLGLIEVLIVTFGYGAWRDMIAFSLIIIILCFRPMGLFGSRYYEDGRA